MKSLVIALIAFLFWTAPMEAQDLYYRLVSPNNEPTSNHWTFAKLIASTPALKARLARNGETPAQVAANSALRSSIVAGKDPLGTMQKDDDILYQATEEIKNGKRQTLIFPVSIERGQGKKKDLLLPTAMVAYHRKNQSKVPAKQVKAATLAMINAMTAPTTVATTATAKVATTTTTSKPAGSGMAQQVASINPPKGHKPKGVPKATTTEAKPKGTNSPFDVLGTPGDGRAKVTGTENARIEALLAAIQAGTPNGTGTKSVASPTAPTPPTGNNVAPKQSSVTPTPEAKAASTEIVSATPPSTTAATPPVPAGKPSSPPPVEEQPMQPEPMPRDVVPNDHYVISIPKMVFWPVIVLLLILVIFPYFRISAAQRLWIHQNSDPAERP